MGATLSWCVAGVGLLASGAAAAAEPAILYLPDQPVVLTPTGVPPCGSEIHSALGCGGVDEVTEIQPFGEVHALAEAMREVLAPYDVLVTHVRPPEYVPYVMLMPSYEPRPESESPTCAYAGINCAARQRNDLAFTSGSTLNCFDPEITHASLYAFGRVSGLEGVANPADVMNYVPDYATAPLGFVDACSDRVPQLGFEGPRPGQEVFECTSDDHSPCPTGENGEVQQNGHQDLLLFYGPRTEDFDPPAFANIQPADGTVLPLYGDLVLDVDIEDADPVVAVRWTLASAVLEDAGIEGGMLSICTNDVCDANWDDATPLKATGSDWSFTLTGLPPGEYTITLEAADFHGNVASAVILAVTVDDDTNEPTTGPPGPSDDGVLTTGAGAEGEGGELDGGAFTSGDDAGSSGSSSDGLLLDRPGCGCRAISGSRGALPLLFGVVVLGAMRRRR